MKRIPFIYKPIKTAHLLALFAALLLALGPAASYLSGSPSKTYIEICTAFGIVKKAVEGDLPSPGESQSHESAPCLFCGLRQFALSPPQLPALTLPFFKTISWPATVTPAIPARRGVSSYNPRGPPIFLS